MRHIDTPYKKNKKSSIYDLKDTHEDVEPIKQFLLLGVHGNVLIVKRKNDKTEKTRIIEAFGD
tara:strand:+ start:63602 stop:63790 length:189 start_codon:yes stop_codon:yes gene_type:complete